MAATVGPQTVPPHTSRDGHVLQSVTGTYTDGTCHSTCCSVQPATCCHTTQTSSTDHSNKLLFNRSRSEIKVSTVPVILSAIKTYTYRGLRTLHSVTRSYRDGEWPHSQRTLGGAHQRSGRSEQEKHLLPLLEINPPIVLTTSNDSCERGNELLGSTKKLVKQDSAAGS
jgi:hypothetical protein